MQGRLHPHHGRQEFMTPVRSMPMREHPVQVVLRVARELSTRFSVAKHDA